MTTLDKMLQGLANALGASLSTLTTTAKTIVGAINELAPAVSSHTATIGSGSLDTTSQTLISAINEINPAGRSWTVETSTSGTTFTAAGNGFVVIHAKTGVDGAKVLTLSFTDNTRNLLIAKATGKYYSDHTEVICCPIESGHSYTISIANGGGSGTSAPSLVRKTIYYI